MDPLPPGPKLVYFRFREQPTKQPMEYYVASKASTVRIIKAVRVHFKIDVDVEISFWSNGFTAVTPSYANLTDGSTYEVRSTSLESLTTPPSAPILTVDPPPVDHHSANPLKHVKFYMDGSEESNPFRCAVPAGDTAHEVVISINAYFGTDLDSKTAKFCTTHGDTIVPDYDNISDNMNILVFRGDGSALQELTEIWRPYLDEHDKSG